MEPGSSGVQAGIDAAEQDAEAGSDQIRNAAAVGITELSRRWFLESLGHVGWAKQQFTLIGREILSNWVKLSRQKLHDAIVENAKRAPAATSDLDARCYSSAGTETADVF